MTRVQWSALVKPVRRVAALALPLLVSAAAHAQDNAAAPQPTLSKAPPVWMGLMVIFFMLVAVILVSIMPSRRTHLD